ncbi:prepilin-type N-terminal cleavage/methylation domain-containing protein [Rhodoferax sp.]|uniref:prepilin-type N-terminal cleavage/methylation domain-containing protein n=1 Tax=Rhodoferax sp. TaxID=50421 RepID=UPI0026186CBD|nr:prepilin-type N-terminal cleavage/methylation domain-containing protein [Rhodoferax sp.]MDD2919238.1 prepilin-type N-terminal cleavage/methylation domain-containing protein [Rhodoferax sp.]
MNPKHSPWSDKRQKGQKGYSLIELMISLVIGLVTVLALTQVAVEFERQKRTTVGAGDTVDAANVALQLMRNGLMSAGHGINSANAIGCALTVYRESNNTTLTLNAANVALPGLFPVYITQGAGTASDTLTVAAGNSRFFAETGLFSSHAGDTGNFVTDSNFGFQIRDLILLTETAGGPCAVRQLSADLSAGNPQELEHQAGTGVTSYNNPAGVVTAAGVPIAFTGAAMVSDLGSAFTIHQYTVANGNFQRAELLTNSTATLFGNAMTLQAQYGFRNADGTTAWCETIGGAGCLTITNDASGWLRLTAVRLALVIRNPQLEGRDRDGNCTTSPEELTWGDVRRNVVPLPLPPWGSFSLGGITDARCYRYQVVETIVPVRNVLWSVPQ